jgi:hypothetical protein
MKIDVSLGRETTLTTGEVAKIMGVSVKLVNAWCDDGNIKCYRVPPAKNSKLKHKGHRRVMLDAVLDFARSHNIQLRNLSKLKPGIMIVCRILDPLAAVLQKELAKKDAEFGEANSAMKAGAMLAERAWNAAILCTDSGVDAVEFAEIAKIIHPRTLLYAITPEDGFPGVNGDTEDAYEFIQQMPLDAEVLVNKVWESSTAK